MAPSLSYLVFAFYRTAANHEFWFRDITNLGELKHHESTTVDRGKHPWGAQKAPKQNVPASVGVVRLAVAPSVSATLRKLREIRMFYQCTRYCETIR